LVRVWIPKKKKKKASKLISKETVCLEIIDTKRQLVSLERWPSSYHLESKAEKVKDFQSQTPVKCNVSRSDCTRPSEVVGISGGYPEYKK
jgi:hypothetical protein